jgi:NAD+ kinase
MFKRVGLIVKPDDLNAAEAFRILVGYLQARNIDICFDSSCAEYLHDQPGATAKPLSNGYDLVIVVGGDGTLLRAAHLISSYDIPLLGINCGHLGFLTDVAPDEIQDRLDTIFAGQYDEEARSILTTCVERSGLRLEQHDAVNDAVIQKWNVARLITLDTYINGLFVHSQRSDGIIVSTPTGSTAYALSGGGPILHPSLDAIALVAICPHALSNRPIVIAGNSRIEIVVNTRDPDHARLTCDGEIRCELEPGDRISVFKAARCIRLIHPRGHDHFATLRAKLQWS